MKRKGQWGGGLAGPHCLLPAGRSQAGLRSARLSDPSWGLCPLLSPSKAWAPAGDTPLHPVRQLAKEAETAGGHRFMVSGCPR